MLFSGWEGIWRTLLVGTLAYVALVLLLRVSGKRTLSKMNAFDLVVTVALGSTLATVLLSKNVALVEGATAFALLILLQFIVAWASVRSDQVRGWVKAQPTLLFHQGEFLPAALREERVTEAEVRAAVRSHGFVNMSQVGAVVLETDGSFSVLKSSHGEPDDVLEGVTNRTPAHRRRAA